MTATSERPHGWVAGDAVAQNEFYVGSRLTYQRARDVEIELIDWASGRRAMWILLRAFGGAFVLGGVFTVLAAAALAYGEFSGGVFQAIGTLLMVLAFLVPPVWIAVALFLPHNETLSEWQLMLDAKAPVADSAYQVVQRALHARQVPAYIQPMRRRVGPPVPGTRNFLLVTLERYQVVVSVFAFGHDLYLGWTLRRREVPWKVVVRWFKSLVLPSYNYSDLIDMEPVRALRESVHNALRQGIEAAAATAAFPPAQETFGEEPLDLPVQSGP